MIGAYCFARATVCTTPWCIDKGLCQGIISGWPKQAREGEGQSLPHRWDELPLPPKGETT